MFNLTILLSIDDALVKRLLIFSCIVTVYVRTLCVIEEKSIKSLLAFTQQTL